MVYADLGKIQQVLYNLIDNAIKFSRENSVIYIQTSLKYEKVFVSVKDTGIGIPAEQQENIFKPFTEVKDLTTGDGLGLPICSLIAAKMNGSLTLDIGYTKGTRFILELHV